MATKSTYSIERGLPDRLFLQEAWASEQLGMELKDGHLTLPEPDEDISLVAKIGKEVIGQCSADRAVKHWDYFRKVDVREQNLSTRACAAIHGKAAQAEEAYLNAMCEKAELAMHNTGIAVLPQYRRQGIATELTKKQVQVCRDNKMTTLFCETSNPNSYAILERLKFTLIANYPYSDLARELECPALSNLKNSSFAAWCLRV